ncbi:MAG: GGDEF domain-containing protein [Epsilonproteobacteria bacterium]|nr:hypothetical protein [Campylobacterota bacterium]NPA56885.1 GGDEF domain-containing protein [Campylobacterota bacterium]
MRRDLVVKILFVAIFALLTALLYSYLSLDMREKSARYLTHQIDRLKAEFRAVHTSYRRLSGFFYDRLRSDPQFLTLLEKQREKALRRYLLRPYQILRHYNIEYLTIYNPEGKVLVAMHQGSLEGKGEGEGGGNLLIRFRKPIYLGDKVIGIFSAATSYNTFTQELKRLFGGSYAYILRNKLINRSVFRYGNYLFVQSDLHPNYYYEEQAVQRRSHRERALIHRINSSIREAIKDRLGKSVNFAVMAEIDGRYYVVSFLAITYRKDHIGYLISYKEDRVVPLFRRVFWQNFILGTLLILSLLLLIYAGLFIYYRLRELATTDELTGALNRRTFYEMARREVSRSQRHGKPFSVVIFDIDRFKEINEKEGYGVGDYIIATVAQLVKSHIRSYDLLFRWGGEEFIIIAPETDIEGGKALAEKIVELIREYPFQKVDRVTVSAGVSQFYPESDTEIEEVIKRADSGRYQSKRDGGDRVTQVL